MSLSDVYAGALFLVVCDDDLFGNIAEYKVPFLISLFSIGSMPDKVN